MRIAKVRKSGGGTVAVLMVAAVCFGAGFSAGRVLPTPPAPAASGTMPAIRALSVPDVRQSTGFSCGAAAFQAVLGYWGIDEVEGDLIAELGSDPEQGTPPHAIARVARARGFQVRVHENLSLAGLAGEVHRGVPVIVAIQAWPSEPSPGRRWVDEWEEGHYVVVVGVDDSSVTVEDPSLLGARGFIPTTEFLDRWHDVDASDRRWVHLGIAIEGDAPAVPRPLIRVE